MSKCHMIPERNDRYLKSDRRDPPCNYFREASANSLFIFSSERNVVRNVTVVQIYKCCLVSCSYCKIQS